MNFSNKKALEAKPQGRTLYTPWYHLGSHAFSQRRPLGVPTHSCAVTCAHVVTYASSRSATQLQDHVRQVPPYLFTPTEALCDGSSCVLFSSSSLCDAVFCYLRFSLHAITFSVNRKKSQRGVKRNGPLWRKCTTALGEQVASWMVTGGKPVEKHRKFTFGGRYRIESRR